MTIKPGPPETNKSNEMTINGERLPFLTTYKVFTDKLGIKRLGFAFEQKSYSLSSKFVNFIIPKKPEDTQAEDIVALVLTEKLARKFPDLSVFPCRMDDYDSLIDQSTIHSQPPISDRDPSKVDDLLRYFRLVLGTLPVNVHTENGFISIKDQLKQSPVFKKIGLFDFSLKHKLEALCQFFNNLKEVNISSELIQIITLAQENGIKVKYLKSPLAKDHIEGRDQMLNRISSIIRN